MVNVLIYILLKTKIGLLDQISNTIDETLALDYK